MSNTDKPINIVGLTLVTTNEAAQNQNTIGKLWDDFLNAPIKEKLTGLLSSSVFAVYSDYENGYMGKYRITVGYAVDDATHVPNGLTAVVIPAQNYQVFKSKSRAVQDIVDTWKTIWEADPAVLQRNFVTDFEEYNDNEVTIHIGCK